MTAPTSPRPWLNDRHLRATVETDAGSISLLPLRATSISFDAAWSNYYPSSQGQHETSALDIGRGVKVRGTGAVTLTDDGWKIKPGCCSFEQDNGRAMTSPMLDRTRALVERIVTEWASTHAGDIAQADDIDRNNAAHRLETQIARYEQALAILRENLTACEQGGDYSMYPDLPTDR